MLLPDPGTITTIKERALFQGQPSKANDLTVVHKDCIFIPSDLNVVVKNVEIVGRPISSTGKNMDLLMPSKFWPADHFAIVCAISTGVSNPMPASSPHFSPRYNKSMGPYWLNDTTLAKNLVTFIETALIDGAYPCLTIATSFTRKVLLLILITGTKLNSSIVLV